MAFSQHEAPLQLGVKAPHVHLTAYDGRSWDLDRFDGRPVILNFWATWCGPCLAEMPMLVEFAAKHADDVVMIGAAVTSPPTDVLATIRRLKVRYPIAAADRATIERYKANSVPLTYLLDAEHRIVWVAQGAVSEVELEAALKLLRAGP